MAGNTLHGTGSKTATGKSFYCQAWVKQPTASSTSNVHVKVQIDYTCTTDTRVTISSTTSANAGQSYPIATTLLGSGTTKTYTRDFAATGMPCNTGSTTFVIKFAIAGVGNVLIDMTGTVYWVNSSPGTTITKNSAPSSVRVGDSTTHANNYTSYTKKWTSSTNTFYITWNAGTAGQNNAISGYRRWVVNTLGGTDYTADTNASTYYNKSYDWGSGAQGFTYQCKVKTLSSKGSSYDSDYSTATAYFKWADATATSRTLTLNANGGSVSPTSKSAAAGTEVDLPTPTRAGYNFLGWYYNLTGSNYINYGTFYQTTQSIRLTFWTYCSDYNSKQYTSIMSCAEAGGYTLCTETTGSSKTWDWQCKTSAAWRICKSAYTNVTAGRHEWCMMFNASAKQMKLYMDGAQYGGTVSTTQASIAYNANVKQLWFGAEPNSSQSPTSGWYFTGKIGNVQIDTGGENFAYADCSSTKMLMPDANYTVYAEWEPKTITVTLNNNGGSGGTGSVNIVYGTVTGSYPSISLPTRTGYTFAGYYTAASGGTQYYNAQGNSVRTFDVTANTTWYAHWTPINGTIYYHAGQCYKNNNPSYNLGIPKSGYQLITSNNQYGFVANSSGTLITATYNITTTAIDLYNTTTFFDAPPGCKHSPEASQWKIWNSTKGSWVSQTGVSAASWNVGSLVANGTITAGDYLIAFANWLPNTYTLTFNADGGSVSPSTKSVTYGTTYTDLPTPTRPGYTFGGWYAKFNGSSDFINYGRAYTFNNKLHVHVMAYMSNWSSYTGGMRMFSCTEGGGWNIETQNTDKISSTLYDYNVGYKALTSVVPWSALSSDWHHFDLVFDGTKGSLYFDRILIAESDTFTSGKIGYHNTNSIFVGAEAGSSPTTPPNNFFNGYIGNIIINNNSDYSTSTPTSAYYNTFTAPAQDVTLYPRWKANTYTVTFNKQEGTGGTDSVTATYGNAMPSITRPSRVNYTFLGYYDATSGGTQYYNSSGASVRTWDKTSDTILCAHWQSTLCTLTMDPAGGKWSGSTTPTTVSTTINYPILLSAPIYGFRVFRGWYDGNTLAGFGGDTFIPTEQVTTLTAHWYDKYFVAISDGTNIKKAIPFVADTTNDEWKMIKSYVNVNNYWKPSGQLPPDDGYTHVVIVDTQFTTPSWAYDMDDDDGSLVLPKTAEFANLMTSHQAYVDFFDSVKRIRVTYDEQTYDYICTYLDKLIENGGGWAGYDWSFSTKEDPSSSGNINFSMYDYDSDIGNWSSWGATNVSHTIKVEALI